MGREGKKTISALASPHGLWSTLFLRGVTRRHLEKKSTSCYMENRLEDDKGGDTEIIWVVKYNNSERLMETQ